MIRSNEWGESLEATIIRSQAQGGLLVYSMLPDEKIEVGIGGVTRDGIQVEEDRIITAALVEQRTGKLHVLEDTASGENWTGKDICLGSSVFSLGEVELARGGLLRGMIGLGQGVVVDFTASHFTREEPTYLMAEYHALSLQDQRIF